MRVLVLNPGSATLKAVVLDLPAEEPLFERTVDWSAAAGGEASDARDAAVAAALGEAAAAGIEPGSVEAVGYRVVHGGERFRAPTLVDDAVVDAIDELADLAPLHNAIAAATIRAGRRALPDVPHVASFDTGFHATLPEVAWRYPVPSRWLDEWGIRRYGFHGLSVGWSVRRAAALLERRTQELRLVVAHLGGGSSVTAVDGGRSVNTSMGLTPLEGLMMGTRSGSIDPGAIIRVVRAGRSIDDVADDLEHRSGLLGVSGRTDDMRELLRAEATGDDAARRAVALFVARAAAGIAAAATALPSVDALVFTGGIGEHAAAIRARIVERLAVLGLARLSDEDGPPADDAGAPSDAVLSAPRTGPAVLRVRAREDVVIASEAAAAVAASPTRRGRG